MGKRRADADTRRFFDEFEKVRVSRFRAMGVIDPAKREALIPFPNGKTKLIGVGHVRLKYGGGYSFFICPKCAKLAGTLHLIEDRPLCWRCCDAMGVKHRSKWGLTRHERRRAADQHLDQIVTNSRRLTKRMRRRMITLRLNQLASQQQKTNNDGLKLTRAYKPRSDALTAIPELRQVWRANSRERLQQALDKAQI